MPDLVGSLRVHDTPTTYRSFLFFLFSTTTRLISRENIVPLALDGVDDGIAAVGGGSGEGAEGQVGLLAC